MPSMSPNTIKTSLFYRVTNVTFDLATLGVFTGAATRTPRSGPTPGSPDRSRERQIVCRG